MGRKIQKKKKKEVGLIVTFFNPTFKINFILYEIIFFKKAEKFVSKIFKLVFSAISDIRSVSSCFVAFWFQL